VPDDLLAFDLFFWDALLNDVGDEVEALVIFNLHNEDVAATTFLGR
jgi:hypothetical protein